MYIVQHTQNRRMFSRRWVQKHSSVTRQMRWGHPAYASSAAEHNAEPLKRSAENTRIAQKFTRLRQNTTRRQKRISGQASATRGARSSCDTECVPRCWPRVTGPRNGLQQPEIGFGQYNSPCNIIGSLSSHTSKDRPARNSTAEQQE